MKNSLQTEQRYKIFNTSTFHNFSASINDLRNDLSYLIESIRKNGKKIAGFGAPAKATTLMHHFKIRRQDIEYIVDDSPLKQGLYTPGYNIPVVSSKHLTEKTVDFLLILAWNFAESIIDRVNENFKYSGKFIVPLPKVKIVNGSG